VRNNPSAAAGMLLAAFFLTCASSGSQPAAPSVSGPSNTRPPGITLTIKNAEPESPLDLVQGQEYVFDRITLSAENRAVRDSQEALDWLRNQSYFRALNWDGVRQGRSFWRNYKETRPEADIYSQLFEGARWMDSSNALELAVLDGHGKALTGPLRLSNKDFLNQAKQWDFDMIQAEFRHEDLTRSKDLSSAKTRHAVAKVVFAIQSNLSKKLRIPKGAASLKIVWDKLPGEVFLVPIRPLTSPLRYGLRLQIKVDPEKDVYMPGDTLRTTFRLLDGSGKPLKISESEQNGITRLITHLDGPRQAPTFYHEEWLNDFRGKRYAHHFRSPALGMERDGRSEIIPLAAPPLDSTGSQIVVDLHIPRNLPPEAYGTFVIGVLFGRDYGGQKLDDSLERPIQVGMVEPTHVESFGCASCHAPGTGMEIGLLLPPMSGIERLRIDRFEECVLCHDNSRDGSRRLDKFLHLIHQNRDNFPASKNNCVVCHLTAASIR